MSTVTLEPTVGAIGVVDVGLEGMCIRVDIHVHFLVKKKLSTSCLVRGRFVKQWFSIATESGASGRCPYFR
jgi:hypothetical protein